MGYVAIDMPKVAQRFTQTSQHHTGAHTVALPAERVVAQSGRDASGKSSGMENLQDLGFGWGKNYGKSPF